MQTYRRLDSGQGWVSSPWQPRGETFDATRLWKNQEVPGGPKHNPTAFNTQGGHCATYMACMAKNGPYSDRLEVKKTYLVCSPLEFSSPAIFFCFASASWVVRRCTVLSFDLMDKRG